MMTSFAGAGHRPGLDGARAQLGPRHQMLGGGETAHVGADLGQDVLGVERADTWDFIEAFHGAKCAFGLDRAVDLDGGVDPARFRGAGGSAGIGIAVGTRGAGPLIVVGVIDGVDGLRVLG